MRTHSSRHALAAVFALFAFGLSSQAAQAQPPSDRRVTLLTGLALTSQTDDETNLGRGVLIAAGVTGMVTRRLRVEGEVAVGRHERSGPDAGALEATGTPITGTARVAWLFGATTSPVRPFVSGGLLLLHSRGEFRSISHVPGPDGLPRPGPMTSRTWRITEPGWEAGLGVEVGRPGRMRWRPEARLSISRGHRDYRPGVDVLETPIITVRGGLTVSW